MASRMSTVTLSRPFLAGGVTVLLSAAFITLGAKLQVPFWPVPMTLLDKPFSPLWVFASQASDYFLLNPIFFN